MKFTVAAVLAAAVGASAHYGPGNVTVVTEVVESYVTYCPGPTEITHGDITYTVTEATTLTITDCPCTITKPVITTSSVVCSTCTEVPSVPAPPPAQNSTVVTVPTAPGPAPTTTPPPTGGAAKAVAVSGAGLAGVLALAALL